MTESVDDPSPERSRPETIAAVGRRATRAVVEALEAAGIDYMVVGSFATNCHAPPRSTKDADLVVAPPGGPVARALRTLAAPFGSTLRSASSPLPEPSVTYWTWSARTSTSSAFCCRTTLTINSVSPGASVGSCCPG